MEEKELIYGDVVRCVRLKIPFTNRYENTDPYMKELLRYKNKEVVFEFCLLGGEDIDLRAMHDEFFSVLDYFYEIDEKDYYDFDRHDMEYIAGRLAGELSRRMMRDTSIAIRWQNYEVQQQVLYRGVDRVKVMDDFQKKERKEREEKIEMYKREITGENDE